MTRRTTTLGFSITLLALLAVLAFTFTAQAAAASKKIKVLLITGDDVGVHPWPVVSQAIKEILVASGKFEVRVCEDPGVLESPASLARYNPSCSSTFITTHCRPFRRRPRRTCSVS